MVKFFFTENPDLAYIFKSQEQAEMIKNRKGGFIFRNKNKEIYIGDGQGKYITMNWDGGSMELAD